MSVMVDQDLPSDDDLLDVDDEVQYKILEHGSKRGGRLLVTNTGYSFGVKVTVAHNYIINHLHSYI